MTGAPVTRNPAFCLAESWAVGHGEGMGDSAVYKTFVDHFSDSRPGTDTFLHTRLATLYPNNSIVATQDRNFDPLRYASGSPTSILVKELDDITSIKKVVFTPSLKRRDGDGKIRESTVLAGYKIAADEREFTAIVATWSDGGHMVTQWHLISADPDAARSFIHDCAAWCSAIREAILVFDQSNWRPDHALWEAVQKASWDDVILDEDLKAKVQHDYRSFFKSEDVYKDLAVPWKRGLIFLGPPGNGKTISIKAIMKDAKVPVLYVKSLHTYGGDEFGIRMIFTRARAEAPCVLILEDLDSLITDQNRSFFLNEVDGLEDNDGLLLIGTTNHFDRLDPALSNRPSRFDRKYVFPNPSRDERRQYAIYWQKKLHSNKELHFPDSLLDDVADKTDNFSFAYLKEVFVSTLLTLAGRENGAEKPSFQHVLLAQIKALRESLDAGDELGMAASWSKQVGTAPAGPGGRGSMVGMVQSSLIPVHTQIRMVGQPGGNPQAVFGRQ